LFGGGGEGQAPALRRCHGSLLLAPCGERIDAIGKQLSGPLGAGARLAEVELEGGPQPHVPGAALALIAQHPARRARARDIEQQALHPSIAMIDMAAGRAGAQQMVDDLSGELGRALAIFCVQQQHSRS
jgi:hypothetical protein